MSTTPDLTVFGRQLKSCLDVHNLDIAQLADRTAIDRQRLDGLIRNATDLRCLELAAIADVFQLESSLLISDIKLPYDTYRVACACNYTTAESGFFRHISRRLQPLTYAPQSEYKKRKDNTDKDNAPLALTSDHYGKITSTLAACWLLQRLWEEEKFSGYKFDPFISVQEDLTPEERGIEAARQFRAKFGLSHDKPVTHIRQYARRIGVHVFRQVIRPAASQEKLPFRGVCLAGKIGDNKEGRIIIFDSSLSYFEEQFCVAHELAHALLDNDLVWKSRPTLREYEKVQEQKEHDEEDREQMADAFAWELLLPNNLPASSNVFREVIDVMLGLTRPGGQVFRNPAKFASELLGGKGIRQLIDRHEGLRDKLQHVAAGYEYRYSPALRSMFECLQQAGYSTFDVDCLKKLIDRGLSHHFVEMCMKAYKNDASKKEDIIDSCSEVFTVSPLRIERAFKMYGHLPVDKSIEVRD